MDGDQLILYDFTYKVHFMRIHSPFFFLTFSFIVNKGPTS